MALHYAVSNVVQSTLCAMGEAQTSGVGNLKKQEMWPFGQASGTSLLVQSFPSWTRVWFLPSSFVGWEVWREFDVHRHITKVADGIAHPHQTNSGKLETFKRTRSSGGVESRLRKAHGLPFFQRAPLACLLPCQHPSVSLVSTNRFPFVTSLRCASSGRRDVPGGCNGELQVVRHVPGATHVLHARNRSVREANYGRNANATQPRRRSANEKQPCVCRRVFLQALARRRCRRMVHVAARRVQARASASRQETVLLRTYATPTVLNVQLFSRICAYTFRRSTSNPTLIFKSWSSCTRTHRTRPRPSVQVQVTFPSVPFEREAARGRRTSSVDQHVSFGFVATHVQAFVSSLASHAFRTRSSPSSVVRLERPFRSHARRFAHREVEDLLAQLQLGARISLRNGATRRGDAQASVHVVSVRWFPAQSSLVRSFVPRPDGVAARYHPFARVPVHASSDPRLLPCILLLLFLFGCVVAGRCGGWFVRFRNHVAPFVSSG